MQEWFDEGKEILVAHDTEEAIELYKWLTGSLKDCEKLGQNARSRVIRDHTYKTRARDLLNFISST
jgi:spore maturation protein CgeB